MRRLRLLLLLGSLLLGSAAAPASAGAQDLVKGALGGAAGVAAGGYVTLALVVAQARAGHYIQGMEDFLGWRSAPVLIGGGTGMAVGLWEPDRLKEGVIGGALGTGAGLALGLVVGPLLWDDAEARWAGGAIGAGLGMVIGSVAGVLMAKTEDGGGRSVPVAFRIRL